MSSTLPIHVACAVDEAYVPHCATMLASLLAAHPRGAVKVHFFHPETASTELFERLARFVRDGGAEFDSRAIPPQAVACAPVTRHLPAIVWFRALLPDLLPELERVLYLDADLIVADRLDELWGTDLDGYCVAAVTNPMDAPSMHWPTHIGLPRNESYFNSGVLLMNLRQLREKECSRKVLEHARTHPELIRWGDQCAFNALFHERRKALHPRWNLLKTIFAGVQGRQIFGVRAVREALKQPAIIHFEGPGAAKPWNYLCAHPYKGLYRQHRRVTPWPRFALEDRNLRNMLRKAYRTAKQGLRGDE